MQSAMRSANLRHLLIVPLLMLAAVLSAGVVFARPADQAGHSTMSNPQPVQGCTSGWEVVASPNGSPYRNRLQSIEALSTTDAWAVGSKQQGEGQLPTTLIEHWDGSQWSVVPNPNPVGGVELYGVSAAAGNDVWAVGGNTSTNTTIILHWNGSSWSIVPSPNVGTFSILYGVTSISATDAWAVGRHTGGGLTLHWDGAIWSVISNPSPSGTELMAVSSLSSSDVWAVGDHGGGTVTIHWDGTQWSLVPSPNTGIRNLLYGVEAISSDDVWAVGEYNMNGFHSLTLHWDGTAWASVPNTGTARLKSVAATATNDAWAVGGYYLGGNPYSTATMHWDGAQWTEVASPNPDPSNNQLFGIDTLSADEAWAVGFQGALGSTHSTLIMRYTASCLTPTLPPASTFTSTPAITPSSTATRTATATVTPTCLPGWSVIASPNRDPVGNNILYDVDAVSANDIWAVGYSGDYGTGVATLVEHWDGLVWSIVPSPNPTGGGVLNGISILGASDIWAVGQGFDGVPFTSQLLVEHWDGLMWSIIPVPVPGNLHSSMLVLYDIHALTADDIWAVGSDGYMTLILHWNGSVWSVISNSTVGKLYAVSAVTPDDVWAVGSRGENPTLTMHWNGVEWTVVPSPSPGANLGELLGVIVLSTSNVWAVGYHDNGALTIHWDGSNWTDVPSPSAILIDVNAISPTDVWAVGFLPSDGSTVALRWNGTEWSRVLSTDPDPRSNQLWSLTQVNANEMWAVGCQVGDCTGNGQTRTLIEKYTGSCTTPTASPSASATNSVTATRTSTVSATDTPSIITTSTNTPTTTPTAQPTCEGIWRTYDMPQAVVNAVAASTDGDVWAVGFATGPIFLPDAQRWNAAAWERMVTLEWTNNSGIFDDVIVIAPDDVWAAGASLTRLFDSWPEVAHWDGTSWTRQSFPSPELESRFSALDAVDESDIWAVGSYFVAGRYRPLIYHYDGLIWRQVASPELPERAGLWGVTAVAQDDVWAVGYTGESGVETTLIEHWNGTTWSVVAAPSLGSLSDVEAISADDAWAVGDGGILHWDGISWNVVSAPSGARAVSAISSDDIWAISAASVLHWDGAEWRVVTTLPADLTDVAAVAPGDVWVVGNVNGSGNISFHYTNQHFIDVPPDNTFYSQVQCLACRGIVSGYADGTFRPNNQVTRGQLAKIVSNSAGFSEIPTQQTFEDVPPSNTFYAWIERLTVRGYMTGYVCGGPGEPCTVGRPYFRPFANATRGQTAKIVSNAAGFTEPPSGQTFQDVPPTHTFYEFIQRLAARNVMQGYACGGPGEPCVNNRPYFRPQNDVTRGQSAKIVANTFFPDCNPEAHP